MGVAPVVGHEVGSLGEILAGCVCVCVCVCVEKEQRKIKKKLQNDYF